MSFVGDFVSDITSASDVEREGRRAAEGIEAATDRALDIGERRYGEARGLLDPFISGGTDAFNQYLAMLGMAPEGVQAMDFTQSPAFQTQQRLGREAINENLAGQGLFHGGQRARDLSRFEQDLFNTQILDRLISTGEMGRGSATNLAQLGQGQASLAGSILPASAQQAGNLRVGAAGVGPQVFGDILGAGATLFGG